jgi:hypothetical protein
MAGKKFSGNLPLAFASISSLPLSGRNPKRWRRLMSYNQSPLIISKIFFSIISNLIEVIHYYGIKTSNPLLSNISLNDSTEGESGIYL